MGQNRSEISRYDMEKDRTVGAMERGLSRRDFQMFANCMGELKGERKCETIWDTLLTTLETEVAVIPQHERDGDGKPHRMLELKPRLSAPIRIVFHNLPEYVKLAD